MGDKVNGWSGGAFSGIVEDALSISIAPSYKFVTVRERVDVVWFESHASLLMSGEVFNVRSGLACRDVRER